MKPLLFTVLIASALAGCAEQAVDDPAGEAEAPETDDPGDPTTFAEGFSSPESVLHDPEQDVYFVSNINGDPTGTDDNGYISRIRAADHGIEPRWIDGARADVTLHAPKGMALVGDELWVADIDTVRRFDRRTGEERAPVAVPGPLFLNDLAAGADGEVFASDTGLAGNAEGFEASSMDAIYRVSEGGAERIATGSDLNRPNGLVVVDSSPWVVTFGANELYRIDGGAKTDVRRLPMGSLDGLVRLADGTFLVSSWDANGIYRGRESGSFELVIESTNSPADIGFDAERNLVLVPNLNENTVRLRPLGEAGR